MKTKRIISMLLALSMMFSVAPSLTVAAETVLEQATQTQIVTAEDPTLSRNAIWDFATASQLADFSLYQSATSSFAISNGMLAPNGTDGEMKAILANTPSNIRSVSVDILPGDSGNIHGGLYIGASDAGTAVDEINSMIFLIQSNFTGWSDAPNRIDIIQGQFGDGWKELSRTVSEAGNGNALFSGGNKQALNLKITFGEDVLLLTLSLVSNPNKYLQLMYEVDSAALIGQIGLRVNGSDTKFDNVMVEYEQELPENSLLWDFSDAVQADNFTFYTNGNDSFTVSDGMLKSTGGNGEMKAIFNEDMANISAMSVDIIPGPSGLMNAGVYVGAKNVSADQDKVDGVAVMVESMFSGWDDAPNRIDLWLGNFTQGWGGEISGSRLISETGNNNALYNGGVKQPLNLKLEFGTDTMTATLSLVNNPNRFVQKTWTMESQQLQGQIGLRNQFIDLCYDNLVITYKEPVELPVPEQETVYVNEGHNFLENDNNQWIATKDVAATPLTLEAWVKVPQGVADVKTAYIVGNSYRKPYVSMQMIQYGALRLEWGVENEDLTSSVYNFDAEVDIRTGKWTHVAYTCNVAADQVICYVNGEVVKTWNDAGLTEITIPDTVFPRNPFAIGSPSTYWSQPVTYKFPGWIADVRLWDKPLSKSEVVDSMMTQYTTSKDGLLFNAPLNELVSEQFEDLSGNENSVRKCTMDDLFMLEEQEHEPGAYSIVVIPDQQIMTNYFPEALTNMYQWIADNREEENIQMVLNVGDMADNCGNITQWELCKDVWELLPDDLPFIVAPGNHDYDTDSGWNKGYGVREQLTLMNEYFPTSLFENYATESGFFSRDMGEEDNCVNQWQAFEVNGNKYMVLALEYVPQEDVIAWANDVVDTHPNHQVFVLTHSYAGNSGNVNVPTLWNQFLSQHDNIIMTFSGHVSNGSLTRRTDKGVNENNVMSILLDAQSLDQGKYFAGLGMVAILRFNADGTQCNVSYYSTANAKYEANSSFTVTLPKQEATYYAVVGTERFTSVSDAVAAANGSIVKILQSTDEVIVINADVTIDLAGCTLSDVTVAEGYSLKLIDTATDSFGEGGSATVTGSVESLTQANGKSYVVTGADNVYTVRRYVAVLTQQVSLGDDLAMSFVVEADKGTTVNVIFNGATTSYDLNTMSADENGNYTISVDLAAAQMTEDITLQFVNSGVVTLEKTYSVRSYAEQILTGDYTDSTKNLVQWMLNYGAKAQLYFDVNTENLANAGYELEDAILPTEYEPMSASGGISDLQFYGASLVFKNKIAVRFYFTGSVDGVSFGDYPVVAKGDMHYVEVDGINPREYADSVILTAIKGEETLTVSYSPLNYILRMSEKGSDSLKALLNALYGYHEAAVRYMPSITAVDQYDNYDTFTIATAEEFAALGTNIKAGYTYEGKTVLVTADLDFSAYKNTYWTPIGTATDHYAGTGFKGHLDGQLHHFKNIDMKFTGNRQGLFGFIENAVIENIILDEGTLTTVNSRLSGVLSASANGCTIRNIENHVSVVDSSNYEYWNIGLVSHCTGTSFEAIVNYGSIKGRADAGQENGGFMAWGDGNSTVSHCYMAGTVTGTASDILGRGRGTTTNSYYLTADDTGTISKADFISGQTAWNLNTLTGTQENTGLWSTTENGPVLNPNKATYTVKVSKYDIDCNTLGETTYYCNQGDTFTLDTAGFKMPACTLNGVTLDGTSFTVPKGESVVTIVETSTDFEISQAKVNKLEAEYADLIAGVYELGINTNHAGYSGTGFVDLFQHNSGAYIQFPIKVQQAGKYALKICYANGGDQSPEFNIYVDDVLVDTHGYAPTGAWTNWGFYEVKVDLSAESKSLKIVAGEEIDDGINIDYISIQGDPILNFDIPSATAVEQYDSADFFTTKYHDITPKE